SSGAACRFSRSSGPRSAGRGGRRERLRTYRVPPQRLRPRRRRRRDKDDLREHDARGRHGRDSYREHASAVLTQRTPGRPRQSRDREKAVSTFPRSPKLVRGGLVLLDPDSGALLRAIALQYNPDTLTRTLQVQGAGAQGGDRLEALRLKGPPTESIKLE